MKQDDIKEDLKMEAEKIGMREMLARITWQPIETAPRDGTRFVSLIPLGLRSGYYKPITTYWCDGLRQPAFVFDGWSTSPQPTHWMPLPDPPENDA